jgi:rubrerythrin
MDERLADKLRARIGRRSFLRGSALAASVIAATSADGLTARLDAVGSQDDGKAPTPDSPSKDPNAPTDEVFLVIHKDESGRDYRVCPQCGFNMYRQERTWTCENCGFSYTE